MWKITLEKCIVYNSNFWLKKSYNPEGPWLYSMFPKRYVSKSPELLLILVGETSSYCLIITTITLWKWEINGITSSTDENPHTYRSTWTIEHLVWIWGTVWENPTPSRPREMWLDSERRFCGIHCRIGNISFHRPAKSRKILQTEGLEKWNTTTLRIW